MQIVTIKKISASLVSVGIGVVFDGSAVVTASVVTASLVVISGALVIGEAVVVTS